MNEKKIVYENNWLTFADGTRLHVERWELNAEEPHNIKIYASLGPVTSAEIVLSPWDSKDFVEQAEPNAERREALIKAMESFAEGWRLLIEHRRVSHV